MKTSLQDEMERLKSLGKPIKEFGITGSVLLFRFIRGLVLVVLGIAFAVFSVHDFGVHSLTITLMIVLLGLMLVVRAYRNLGLRVLVYPEAGIWIHGDRAASFFWDEIVRLYKKTNEIHLSIWKGSLILQLEKANGETIQIDDALPELRELAGIIEEKTFPYLFSSAISSLKAGQSVHFRALVVHPSGLEIKKGVLPWQEIKEIKWEEDNLAIYKKGNWMRWCKLNLSHIPNYHVVSPLVSEMLRSRSLEVGEP